MADRYVTVKWGAEIERSEKHIAYLEEVQRRFPHKPNFRGQELDDSRRYLEAVKAEMKRLGKRKSSSFLPSHELAAVRIARGES